MRKGDVLRRTNVAEKIQSLSLFDGPRGDPPESVWPNPRFVYAGKTGASPGPAVVGGHDRRAPDWPGSTHRWRENIVAQCQYTVVPQLLFPSTPFEGKLETADCRTPSPLGWGKGVRPSAAGL